MFDLIRVVDLEVYSKIGVSSEEREQAQGLLVSLELRVKDIGPASLTDNVKLTVDYGAAAERVKAVADSRPRKLLETLAEEIATDLLKMFPISSLSVEIKKFVLPGTRYVSIIIERPKEERTASVFRPGHSTSLRMPHGSGPLTR